MGINDHTSAAELLAWAHQTYGDGLVLSTSFQSEGMVIVDMAARVSPSIRVFTIDTGRLPPETHKMIATVESRYGISIGIVEPDAAEVAGMVSRHGRDLFLEGVPQRMLCCELRKVRPLDRYLKRTGATAVLVGLRRSQSESRASVPRVDESGSVAKICPLADWSKAQVDDYIREHHVPVHPLYARGYASIGCGPCTRAIEPGESERAGRWWWEENAVKECGIHFTPDGKAARAVDVMLDAILAAPRL